MYTLHIHTHKVKNCGVGFNDDFVNLRGTIIYSMETLLNCCTPELSTQCSLETYNLNGHILLCMFLGDDFSGHQIFSA